MCDSVPRDHLGRSNYRLAAIRPSQIDLDDADMPAFIEEISERTAEFLQIVNYNLRGSQYAIAGTVRGLEVLEELGLGREAPTLNQISICSSSMHLRCLVGTGLMSGEHLKSQ